MKKEEKEFCYIPIHRGSGRVDLDLSLFNSNYADSITIRTALYFSLAFSSFYIILVRMQVHISFFPLFSRFSMKHLGYSWNKIKYIS